MDNFWKGSFFPLRKHVIGVRFTLFEDMTPELWEVFDYPNLRPHAQRNFQRMMQDCSITGFYIVDFDLHKAHGGKSRYIHPTADEEGRVFSEEAALSEFGNFENYDDDAAPLKSFEISYSEMIVLPKYEIIRRIAYAIAVAYTREQMQDEEAEREAERITRGWPEWAIALLAMRYEKCGVPNST